MGIKNSLFWGLVFSSFAHANIYQLSVWRKFDQASNKELYCLGTALDIKKVGDEQALLLQESLGHLKENGTLFLVDSELHTDSGISLVDVVKGAACELDIINVSGDRGGMRDAGPLLCSAMSRDSVCIIASGDIIEKYEQDLCHNGYKKIKEIVGEGLSRWESFKEGSRRLWGGVFAKQRTLPVRLGVRQAHSSVNPKCWDILAGKIIV